MEIDHSDRVGVIKRDVGNVSPGIDGDRVGARAVGRFLFAGHPDRKPEVDLTHHLVGVRVNHRNAVVIGIGDQQIVVPERHTRWVMARRDAAGDRKRGQIDHGNGAGGGGASGRFGHNRGAVGVFLEIIRGSDPAGLVGDVGGLAIRRNHHAVRDVAHADLRTLGRGGRGQVDLRQRIVVVQHDISGLAILRDRDAGGIGSERVIGENRNGVAARNIEAARGPPRAVREARHVGELAGGVDIERNFDLCGKGVGAARRCNQAGAGIDPGDGDVARRAITAVLAKQQVFAVRRISNAALAAVRIGLRGGT